MTGAASGIGLASAQRLAREGARVALVDVDSERVEQAAADIPDAVATVTPILMGNHPSRSTIAVASWFRCSTRPSTIARSTLPG